MNPSAVYRQAVVLCERHGLPGLPSEIRVAVADDGTPAVFRPRRALTRREAIVMCQVWRLIYSTLNGEPLAIFDDERENSFRIARLLQPRDTVDTADGDRLDMWPSLAELAG